MVLKKWHEYTKQALPLFRNAVAKAERRRVQRKREFLQLILQRWCSTAHGRYSRKNVKARYQARFDATLAKLERNEEERARRTNQDPKHISGATVVAQMREDGIAASRLRMQRLFVKRHFQGWVDGVITPIREKWELAVHHWEANMLTTIFRTWKEIRDQGVLGISHQPRAPPKSRALINRHLIKARGDAARLRRVFNAMRAFTRLRAEVTRRFKRTRHRAFKFVLDGWRRQARIQRRLRQASVDQWKKVSQRLMVAPFRKWYVWTQSRRATRQTHEIILAAYQRRKLLHIRQNAFKTWAHNAIYGKIVGMHSRAELVEALNEQKNHSKALEAAMDESQKTVMLLNKSLSDCQDRVEELQSQLEKQEDDKIRQKFALHAAEQEIVRLQSLLDGMASVHPGTMERITRLESAKRFPDRGYEQISRALAKRFVWTEENDGLTNVGALGLEDSVSSKGSDDGGAAGSGEGAGKPESDGPPPPPRVHPTSLFQRRTERWLSNVDVRQLATVPPPLPLTATGLATEQHLHLRNEELVDFESMDAVETMLGPVPREALEKVSMHPPHRAIPLENTYVEVKGPVLFASTPAVISEVSYTAKTPEGFEEAKSANALVNALSTVKFGLAQTMGVESQGDSVDLRSTFVLQSKLNPRIVSQQQRSRKKQASHARASLKEMHTDEAAHHAMAGSTVLVAMTPEEYQMISKFLHVARLAQLQAAMESLEEQMKAKEQKESQAQRKHADGRSPPRSLDSEVKANGVEYPTHTDSLLARLHKPLSAALPPPVKQLLAVAYPPIPVAGVDEAGDGAPSSKASSGQSSIYLYASQQARARAMAEAVAVIQRRQWSGLWHYVLHEKVFDSDLSELEHTRLGGGVAGEWEAFARAASKALGDMEGNSANFQQLLQYLQSREWDADSHSRSSASPGRKQSTGSPSPGKRGSQMNWEDSGSEPESPTSRHPPASTTLEGLTWSDLASEVAIAYPPRHAVNQSVENKLSARFAQDRHIRADRAARPRTAADFYHGVDEEG